MLDIHENNANDYLNILYFNTFSNKVYSHQYFYTLFFKHQKPSLHNIPDTNLVYIINNLNHRPYPHPPMSSNPNCIEQSCY